jgi:hypothetical protein
VSLTTTEKKFVIGGILLAAFFVAGAAYSLIRIGFNFLDDWQHLSNRLDAAPYIKASVIITSKDTDGRLSLKSSALPKGGDRVAVDRFAYGAASVGEVACVQYKSIADDPQYGTEFVGNGSCPK